MRHVGYNNTGQWHSVQAFGIHENHIIFRHCSTADDSTVCNIINQTVSTKEYKAYDDTIKQVLSFQFIWGNESELSEKAVRKTFFPNFNRIMQKMWKYIFKNSENSSISINCDNACKNVCF